jgi:signal transduction histidine kinase
VLRVISSFPGDLGRVFGAILENATRICEAKFGVLVLTEGEKFRMAAMHGAPPAWIEKRTREPVFTPGPSNNLVLATRSKETQHVADLQLHRSYIEHDPAAVALADIAGAPYARRGADAYGQRADELTDTLRGNLEKVVQHGKRADAIVKSMLLHSGESSGEHQSTDINPLVEESLNRAYHNARAEKRGFTIKLERSFDPAAGEVDLFPREITRALLNLISNGFYAATKRNAEAKGADHKPTLATATKSLGDRVEIRIRDNGTGIPADVKEKMFDPFFTTNPAGEGTGLGLSISHDIIVKQHGGSIEVDTEPNEFAEIRVILPRGSGAIS